MGRLRQGRSGAARRGRRIKDRLGSGQHLVAQGCVSAWCERADMADGAGGWPRGPGGSKHAGSLTGMWRSILDICECMDLWIWAMLVQRGGWWQKKGPELASNSALMQAMDNVCHAEFTYGSGIRRCMRGGGGHRTYTTMAGFNVGLVSDGRWQRRRCICTGQLAIGEADGLDTRRTPFPLIVALQRVCSGRERRVD